MQNNSPVFIVGTPRSGTTLLAAILGSHSFYSCGPETHFFSFLTNGVEQEVLKNWPINAVNFVCSLKIENEYVHQLYSLSRKDIYYFLSKRSPSIKAILESLTLQYAIKHSKLCWIEKTPRHLLYLPKILKFFPEAKVIRIVRDCRDVALSLSKVPWGYKSLLQGVYRCLLDEYFSKNFFNLYLSIKFEDLLENPENTIKKICDFLSIDYEPTMLEFYRLKSNLSSEKEWWKKSIEKPIDLSKKCRWKKELDKEKIYILTYFARNWLLNYRYEIDFLPEPKETLFLFPLSFSFLENKYSIFRELLNQRVRLVGCPSFSLFQSAIEYELPDKCYFKSPLLISNIDNSFTTRQRISTLFSFIKALILLSNTNIKLYYFYKDNTFKKGILDRILNRSLKFFCEKEFSHIITHENNLFFS